MNRFSRYILAVTLCLFGFTQLQAEGYHIKVRISTLPNDTIYLAYHFGDKQYMQDTTVLDSGGNGAFKGDEELIGGFYLVVLPSKNYFEIIVNEQDFFVENDTANFQQHFKSSGTVENEIFYNDIRFLGAKHQEKNTLKAALKAAEKDKAQTKVTELKDQISQLDEEVRKHRESVKNDNPELFYSKFLKSLDEPVIPESPKDENGKQIDSLFGYKFYKSHYFDNIDLQDERMLRTPTLHNAVMRYIEKVVMQVPDSLSAGCDVILEGCGKNEDTFKYWLISLLNKYAKSKIMGMDAVYVHLVEKYYDTGRAKWTSDDDVYRISDRAKRLKPTLIGKKAPNMHLQTPDKKPVSLHGIDAKYTLVFIYAPDCGHCKKETPKILKTYEKIVDTMGIDLKIFAVPTMHLHKGDYDDNKRPIYSDDPKDVNEWPDFIKEFKIGRWINAADLYLHDHFRELYDVESTPKIYLLDKDKIIRAKRINSELLLQIIEDFEKKSTFNK